MGHAADVTPGPELGIQLQRLSPKKAASALPATTCRAVRTNAAKNRGRLIPTPWNPISSSLNMQNALRFARRQCKMQDIIRSADILVRPGAPYNPKVDKNVRVPLRSPFLEDYGMRSNRAHHLPCTAASLQASLRLPGYS